MTSCRPRLSVVIPTSGAPQTLTEQLDALALQVGAPMFEVILVGNRDGGHAAECAGLWRHRLQIRHVAADLRAGASYARNVGIKHANGEKVVFVDDDDVVAPGYLAAMCAALDDHPAVGAAIDLERLNPGWRQRCREVPQTSGLGLGPVPFAYSATLGVRRDVLDRVGGFDESLDGIAGEDVEWCRRLAQAGYSLHYEKSAVLHYRLRTAYRSVWVQGLRYGRGGAIVDPAWPGWGAWLRSLLGPIRLAAASRDRGMRRRGVFLVARRLGLLEARRRTQGGAQGST